VHEYADYRADLRLVIAPNNVPSNPCAYMGKALPPSAYAAQGAASNIYSSPLDFAADVASAGGPGPSDGFQQRRVATVPGSDSRPR
jgi:hypothetical protein